MKISDFFECLSKWTYNKEKWILLMDEQQRVLEKIDKCGCDKEFKNFMLRKHRMENIQCNESSKISPLDYCRNFTKLIHTKEVMIEKLNNVTTCNDLNDILKEFGS